MTFETARDGASFPGPTKPEREPTSSEAPLAGIRVLDFTRVLSGPHAGRMLHDLGAEVIKVEPPGGDPTRFTSPREHGIASYFAQQNSGKLNISLDLHRPEAIELLVGVMPKIDVLLENFRPDVMNSMGLGYDVVATANPRIIYASISGYGASGPWRNRRAYASVIGAETGFTKAQGDAHPAPGYVNDPHSHADVYTGLECASGVLAALFQRERTGSGQWIDISMAQTMLYVNEHLHDHLWEQPVVNAIRSFQPGDYPVLMVANGDEVVISGHPAENGTFDNYVTAIGRADLIGDPRFATVTSRLQHLDELVDYLRAWAIRIATPEALEAAFEPFRLAVGALRSVRDIADSPWAKDRDAIVSVSNRSGGMMRIPNAPWKFSAATTTGGGIPKYRGEDNSAVFTSLLGVSAAEIARLSALGILSSRIPSSAK